MDNLQEEKKMARDLVQEILNLVGGDFIDENYEKVVQHQLGWFNRVYELKQRVTEKTGANVDPNLLASCTFLLNVLLRTKTRSWDVNYRAAAYALCEFCGIPPSQYVGKMTISDNH